MSELNDLEPQQYQRQYFEDDVPLKDVRASALRSFVYVGLLLFLLILAAGFLVRFPEEVKLDFLLKTDQQEDIYRFPFPVYLEEKLAQTGEAVKKDAAIVRISSPEIAAMISAYEEATQKLQHYTQQKTLSLADQKAMLDIRSSQNLHRIQELRSQIAINESNWRSNKTRLDMEAADATQKWEQHQSLYKGKYISGNELKEYELRKVRTADERSTAMNNYSKNQNTLAELIRSYELENGSLLKETDRVSMDALSDSLNLVTQLQMAGDRIENTFGHFEIIGGSILLRAREDGIVSFLFEGDREVAASAVLLRISKGGKGLYATAVTAPAIVGRLARAQKAYLKVASFPAYEFGALRGHIAGISTTADEKGNFAIRVNIDDLHGLEQRLQPGMDGVMNIQISEKSLFGYIFRGLKKQYQHISE